jgi:hypothetical protein
MAQDKITVGEQRGRNPKGNVTPISIDGTAYQWDTPLAANEEKSTGWIAISGYKSLHYIIQSDVAGNIMALEYSTDGTNVSAGGTARAYQGDNLLLQTFVALKDNYFRIRYKNGSTPQTKFFFEARLSTSVGQNTMNSVFLPITQTNVASIVKSVIELSDGASYGQVGRTGDAMKVQVVNGQDPTDVSGLATADKQDDLNNLLGAYAQIAATASKQDAILQAIQALNPAQQQTLADILAKLPSDPTTSAKQDALLAALNSKDFATAAKQDALLTAFNAEDFANQTTLAAILAKLNGSLAVTGNFYQATQPVSLASTPLPAGAATSAKQDLGNTALSSIDTKVSTSAKQDTGNTSLANIDGKVATSAKQDVANTSLASIDNKLTSPLHTIVDSGQLNVAIVSNETRDFIWQQTLAGNVFMWSSGVISGLVALTNIRAYINNPVGSGKTLYIFSLVIDNGGTGGLYASVMANPTTNLPTTAKAGINMNMGASSTTAITCFADTGTAMTGGVTVPSAFAAPNMRTEFLEDQQIFVVPAGSKIGINVPIIGVGINFQVVLYGVVM